MTEPDIKISKIDLDSIKDQLKLINNLTGSIKSQAFHRGFQIITSDIQSIQFSISEINKILKDIK